MGCAHRCAFCYVRGFERRADRPSDERYGTNVRVKVNVVEVLRARAGAPRLAPRDGRHRRGHRSIPAGGGPLPADAWLHRGARARRAPRSSIITRGPLIVRDVDVLCRGRATRGGAWSASASPRSTSRLSSRLEPGVAPPRQRLRAIRTLTDAGIAAGVALAPVLPGLTDAPRRWPRCCAPRARPAPRTRGRTSSTCAPGRASTSSPSSSASGRPSWTDTGASTRPEVRATCGRRCRSDRAAVAAVRRGSGVGDRRRIVLVAATGARAAPLRSIWVSLTEAQDAREEGSPVAGRLGDRACRGRRRTRAAPSGRPRLR